MSTQRIQRKVRNIERDPRVTVLIDSSTMPYRGAMISGEATIEAEDAETERISIFERYVGDRDAAVAHAAELAKKWEPVIVRIEPTTIISFDDTKGSLTPE